MVVALTAIITITGSFLILILRPVGGLIVYCIGLFAYPQYVTLSIATLDFSVSRVLILVLFLKFVLYYRLQRQFRWEIPDTIFLLAFILPTLSLFANESPQTIIVRQGGVFLDTILSYLCIRMAIRKREDFLKFVKGAILVGIYLAILGVYQSVTWHNPMGFLKYYAAWDYMVQNPTIEYHVRHNLYRSDVTFGQYIGFGMFFAALCPICLTLKAQDNGWATWRIWGCFVVLFFGLVSSMSSGPLFSIVVAICFLFFYPYRRFWKLALAGLIFLCFFVELYSNRHFYDVLTRFAFSGQTATYRIELYEEAFGGGMRDHWLCGWGYAGLYPRGPDDPFNWKHRDMTSQYIAALMRHGLMGLIPLLIMTFYYYRRLYQAYCLARTERDQWVIWCLTAALVGWSVGTLTVGFVGQMVQLSSLLIGIACNMPDIIRHQTFTSNMRSPTVRSKPTIIPRLQRRPHGG